MKNYYQILGLEEGATLDEIKAAYRKYAAKFHPDKYNDDEFFKERFQEIQEAYEYLSEHYEDIDDKKESNENEYRLTSPMKYLNLFIIVLRLHLTSCHQQMDYPSLFKSSLSKEMIETKLDSGLLILLKDISTI